MSKCSESVDFGRSALQGKDCFGSLYVLKTRQYPSHWVDIDLLHQALLPIDKATGQPRGYVILSVAVDPPSSTLFKVAYNKQSWKALIRNLKTLSFSGPLEGDLQSLLNKISSSPIKVREVPAALAQDAARKLAECRAALQPLHTALKVDTSDEQLLFLLALLRSHVIPCDVRSFSVRVLTKLGSLPSEVEEELVFLTGQIDSLGRCCSTEKELACSCNGDAA